MTEIELQEKRHEFFFETPLYTEVFFTDNDAINQILKGEVDAFNSSKSVDTTFTIQKNKLSEYDWRGYYRIDLSCKRYGTNLFFIVGIGTDFLIKIGQYPSLADIQYATIGKKYDKILSKEDLKNFKKAIGLASHGAGAGSFVYLRRIFENLIVEIFEINKIELNCNEEDFKTKRMTDKIEVLKEFLPKQLLKMKSVYSILSNGVHELEEEQCLEYFPVLKLSIELILDEKIEVSKNKLREEEVNKTIQKISADLKK